MKYTIEELLFAAAVRDLASAMKSSAKPRAENEQWQSAEFADVMAKWESANPVSSFVPAALGRITEVADIIRANINPA